MGWPALRASKVLDQERGLERVGVVVVERRALFQPQIVAIAVVTVVLEDDDVLGAQAVHDPADDGGLT